MEGRAALSRRAHEATRCGHRGAVRISVVGTGYLGATHAACLAACGHHVIGIDTNPLSIDRLSSGRAPFHEPGLDRLLTRGVRTGPLSFSTDYAAASQADVHFICVGTPQSGHGHAADLSALWEALASLGPLLDKRTLVVGKSTVPVGTAAAARDLVRRLAPAGDVVEMAWNPEFLREGYAVQDSLRPDRLVFGVESHEADLVLREVYAPLISAGVLTVRTDLATSELARAAANVMLAARVSLVNLFAEVCEGADADVGDLRKFWVMTPGSVHVFSDLGSVTGVAVCPKTRAHSGSGLLGARRRGRGSQHHGARGRFQTGSEDVRDSVALDIASRLHRLGAQIRVSDPAALPSW